MKKRLKGGIVVSGGGAVLADVVLDGEKVAAVGLPEEMELLAGADAEVVDVSGCLLFPGFIDAHTHFDLHVAGTVTADDFYTGTKAAIGGGTTTIVDFGTQYPGETLAQGLANWHEKADGKCSCDYGFHMSITEWNPEISREVQDMMDEGITSFKLYMTYDTQVDDQTIFSILRPHGRFQPSGHQARSCGGGGHRPSAETGGSGGYSGGGGPSDLPGRLRRHSGGQEKRPEGLCGDLPSVSADGRQSL